MADKPYRDPKTTKIEDWPWRPLEQVADKLSLREVPDYIQKGFGEFMNRQSGRAQRGEMTPRDLIKAYTIAQSSIGRGGLSHATATKTGMRLPNTGYEVRPEGAFAEWLGSPEGQRYLDAAERGITDDASIADLQGKFAPFGKQNDQAAKMILAVKMAHLMAPNLNKALTGSTDDYRDYAEQMKGIAGAKSGFIGSLLGRGDLPTLDARQLNLHALPAAVGVNSIMSRGKGKGAREAVDRLASRQKAMGFSIDPSLQPHYQHLAHHAVWDKASGTQTTHDDLMRAMSSYADGGSTTDIDAMKLALMNKAKFMKGSKAPERLYHGTGNLESLHSFDPAMTGKGLDQLGSGFYFASDPQEASGYAMHAHNAPSRQGEGKIGGDSSPGVVAAHVNIKKPIRIGKNGMSLNDAKVNLTHDQVKRIMGHAPNINHPDESPLGNHVDTSRGVTPQMIHDIAKLYTGNNLHALENDIFPDEPTAYRNALHQVTGYDGVIKDFGNGRKHYVAWFPHQIKSAIGNKGGYDPSNPDITMADGGTVKDYITITERPL